VTIYALTDPDSGEVCYVGRTTNNPWQRYSEHLMAVGKSATKVWIRELRAEHKVPALKILEERVSVESAGGRERYWISYWRSQGSQLLNYAHKPKPVYLPRSIIPASPGSLTARLQASGITRPIELARALGVDRRYASMVWRGQRRLGAKLAMRLWRAKKIPLDKLLEEEAEDVPTPKGRPRKQAPEGGAGAWMSSSYEWHHGKMGGPIGQPKVWCKRRPYGEMSPDEDQPMIKYDEDFYGWTQEQAEYLRAGLWDAVDAVHVAEEIEDVGSEQIHTVQSHLTNLLMHLLKWRYQPTHRSRSWRVSIRNARIEIRKRLTRSHTLAREIEGLFTEAYEDARQLASDETGLAIETFPEDCQWRLQDILSQEFLPSDVG
jgi:hypothetical protein